MKTKTGFLNKGGIKEEIKRRIVFLKREVSRQTRLQEEKNWFSKYGRYQRRQEERKRRIGFLNKRGIKEEMTRRIGFLKKGYIKEDKNRSGQEQVFLKM